MGSKALAAIVIVDPPDLGGECTLMIGEHKFVLRGRIVKGLRALIAQSKEQAHG